VFAPILAHTEVLEGSPYRRESLIDYTLAGIENLVGFISAYVVLRPSRTVVGAEPSSINRKLKDKSFANNVNRETISNAVEHSKLDRAEFIRLVIDALSTNAKEIGM
jgi:predicted hydrolase (HD superfamily)